MTLSDTANFPAQTKQFWSACTKCPEFRSLAAMDLQEGLTTEQLHFKTWDSKGCRMLRLSKFTKSPWCKSKRSTLSPQSKAHTSKRNNPNLEAVVVWSSCLFSNLPGRFGAKFQAHNSPQKPPHNKSSFTHGSSQHGFRGMKKCEKMWKRKKPKPIHQNHLAVELRHCQACAIHSNAASNISALKRHLWIMSRTIKTSWIIKTHATLPKFMSLSRTVGTRTKQCGNHLSKLAWHLIFRTKPSDLDPSHISKSALRSTETTVPISFQVESIGILKPPVRSLPMRASTIPVKTMMPATIEFGWKLSCLFCQPCAKMFLHPNPFLTTSCFQKSLQAFRPGGWQNGQNTTTSSSFDHWCRISLTSSVMCFSDETRTSWIFASSAGEMNSANKSLCRFVRNTHHTEVWKCLLTVTLSVNQNLQATERTVPSLEAADFRDQ